MEHLNSRYKTQQSIPSIINLKVLSYEKFRFLSLKKTITFSIQNIDTAHLAQLKMSA